MKEKSLKSQEAWLRTSYQLFGQIGKDALNIEKLSFLTNLSRSSFYHHFSDLHGFEKALLEYHLKRFQVFSDAVHNCNRFAPDLLEVIHGFEEETLFQRYLLIYESTTKYFECYNQAKEFSEKKLYALWSAHLEEITPIHQDITMYRVIRDFLLIHKGQTEDFDLEKEIHRIEKSLHLT